MSDFTYNHFLNYCDYPYDFSLPEDLYQEDDQMPEFDYSLIDDLYEIHRYDYLHPDYWCNGHETNLYDFHSEPVFDPQFPMAFHGYSNHDVSGPNFYQPYGQTDWEDDYSRISQVWPTSVANQNKLANDSETGFVDGKCIDKGNSSKGILLEAKNFGLSSGDDAKEKVFEKFRDCFGTYVDDLAPSLCQSERQKQPVQNTSINAGTEENYSHSNCCSNGEQWKAELQQTVSSLTAHVVRLEIQLENLTHQVQDMTDKLSGENKLIVPMSDQTGDSKAVPEESEIISSADHSDWEII